MLTNPQAFWRYNILAYPVKTEVRQAVNNLPVAVYFPKSIGLANIFEGDLHLYAIMINAGNRKNYNAKYYQYYNCVRFHANPLIRPKY